MKGMPAAAALDELNKLAGKPLFNVVDMFAGTSIGGIEVALESIGKSATPFFSEDGPEIFKRRWNQIFPLYRALEIEHCLKKRFCGAALKDCKTRLLVTALDRKSQSPFLFKNYDTSNLVSHGATPLWQVCRATSAAQFYFPKYKLGNKVLWDGGNVANNPAMCAYADAVKLWGDKERIKMLALGCGSDPVKVPSWWPEWLQDIVLTLLMPFQTGAEDVDYQMSQILGNDYRSLQPKFPMPVALDSASPQLLSWDVAAAKSFVNTNRDNFKWFLE